MGQGSRPSLGGPTGRGVSWGGSGVTSSSRGPELEVESRGTLGAYPVEPTAQQGDPGQDTLTLGPPWPSRPCWKLQPLPRAAASRPTAGLGSATSFFQPPQLSHPACALPSPNLFSGGFRGKRVTRTWLSCFPFPSSSLAPLAPHKAPAPRLPFRAHPHRLQYALHLILSRAPIPPSVSLFTHLSAPLDSGSLSVTLVANVVLGL